MKGTQKQEALEQLYGKPLKDILVDLHLEYEGNVARVAARLGVTNATVYGWRRQSGLSPVDMELAILQRRQAQEPAKNGQ